MPRNEGERLSRMGRFADMFRRDEFEFSEESAATFSPAGLLMLPMANLSPGATAFVQTCYDDNWIRPDIDWPKWIEGDEAESLLSNPALIAKSSIDQLEHILTALVRSDRFSEGALAHAYQRGILTAVVVRCAELAVEQS